VDASDGYAKGHCGQVPHVSSKNSPEQTYEGLHLQIFVSPGGTEINGNNLAAARAMAALRVHRINKICILNVGCPIAMAFAQEVFS